MFTWDIYIYIFIFVIIEHYCKFHVSFEHLSGPVNSCNRQCGPKYSYNIKRTADPGTWHFSMPLLCTCSWQLTLRCKCYSSYNIFRFVVCWATLCMRSVYYCSEMKPWVLSAVFKGCQLYYFVREFDTCTLSGSKIVSLSPSNRIGFHSLCLLQYIFPLSTTLEQ